MKTSAFLRYLLLPAACLSLAENVGGNPPAWWSESHFSDPNLPEPDLPPVLNGNEVNNFGPANIGQAKHMAWSALLELREISPQLASEVEASLVGEGRAVAGWLPSSGQVGFDTNHGPLLIGHLKAVAAPFYDSLHQADPDWLDSQLMENQTKDPGNPANYYPWTTDVGDDENRGLASIGQLKAVFSLKFGGIDCDGDGLSDVDERTYGTNPLAVDSDGDGLDDLSEISSGTNPLVRDSDGDGVQDGDEFRVGSDPLANNDLDSDGMPDDWEEFLSVSLLEIFPDPVHWGEVRYAQLVAGDLDPGQSYTSEGMSAGNVCTLMKDTEDADEGGELQFEWQEKEENFIGSYDAENEEFPYNGTGSSSSPEWSRRWIMTQYADSSAFGSSALLSRFDGLTWASVNVRESNGGALKPQFNKYPFDLEAERVGTMAPHAHSNYFDFRITDHSTGMIGRKKVNRVRLVSRKPVSEDVAASWLKIEYVGSASNAIDPDRIQNTSTERTEIGKGGISSDWITVDVEVPAASEGANDGNNAALLAVGVEELFPKLVDENDTEIPGSDKPNCAGATAMVERDPMAFPPLLDASTVRIAWRDMKVRIGTPLAGKSVTWSMTPQFTPWVWAGEPYPTDHYIPDPNGPRFRGKWGTAANLAHRNLFSASVQYADLHGGSYGYVAWTQMWEEGTNVPVTNTARTTVDPDGFTAIRVNLPPIGFNKARIRIEIEGVDSPIDLIDLEVPAVVVIDPGHGGDDGGAQYPDPSPNPEALEADLTSEYSDELVAKLRSEFTKLPSHCRVVKGKQAKSDGKKYPNDQRPVQARERGADIFHSIHFNSGSSTATGPETIVDDPSRNVNLGQDRSYAARILAANQAVVGAGNRDNPSIESAYIVLKDSSLGNTDIGGVPYHTIRACISEVDFITNTGTREALVGEGAARTRANYAKEITDAIINDIMIQP